MLSIRATGKPHHSYKRYFHVQFPSVPLYHTITLFLLSLLPPLLQVDKVNETNYYDSVTGKLLYTAPRGRTFEEFKAESKSHGWPSFRDSEVKSPPDMQLHYGFCQHIPEKFFHPVLRHTINSPPSTMDISSFHLTNLAFR
jgi:hypothetical protein